MALIKLIALPHNEEVYVDLNKIMYLAKDIKGNWALGYAEREFGIFTNDAEKILNKIGVEKI